MKKFSWKKINPIIIMEKTLGFNKCVAQKIILFTASILVLSEPVFAKKKKPATAEPGTEPRIVASDVELVSEDKTAAQLKLPSAKRTFFNKIPQEIIDGVEKGSPASLRDAMTQIRKSESEYVENEKILIAVATEIMKTVWPSEKQTWDTFAVDSNNLYMGAIESEQNGIFDTSTGNSDFLLTIIPAFVIFRPTYNASQYEVCLNAVKQALTYAPDSVLANYMMGLLLEKNNEYAEAKVYLQKAYNGGEPAQELSLACVRVFQKTGDVASAAFIMQNLPSDTPNLEILKQNAYVAFASKDYIKAEQYVARVLQQTPNDLEFVLFRAKILIEKKDYIHAVSLLDMYARQNDTNYDYLLLRARVQLDWSKNTAAATETIEKALQLYPDRIEALMFAARISSATDSLVAGKYADELSAKVLEKEPDNEDALLYAMNGLAQRQNWQEAYAISSKLIQRNDVSTEVVESHVKICVKLGKRSEAYELAKKMHDAAPEDEGLLQAYILAYSEYGNRDTVIKYIDSLMNGASAKMKSYLYYRRSYLQYSEDSALADLRSSLISNPRNADSLFRLYEIYYGKKDYRKAQYYLRQVVAINPNDTSVKKLNEALTKLIQ